MRPVTIVEIANVYSKSKSGIEQDLKQAGALPLKHVKRPRLYDLDDPLVVNALRPMHKGLPFMDFNPRIDPNGKLHFPINFQPSFPWDDVSDIKDPDPTICGVLPSKIDLECKKLDEQTRALKLANDRKRASLIDRLIVQKLLAELFSVESIELGTLSDAIGDELLALYNAKTELDLRALKDLVNINVTRTLEHLTRKIDMFLKKELT